MNYSRLIFNRVKGRPLYGQLFKALEDAIETGELKDGVRLPSERDLAEQLKVSRTTVVNAYRELESRGLVRSHVGRGTFICARTEPADAPFAWRGKVSVNAAHMGSDPVLRQLIRDASNPRLISFAAGFPALECFPVDDYRRLTERLFKRNPTAALGLGPTEGQPPLRKALASRFNVSAEKILVLSGAQQGLDLIARCLLDPGDAVIIDRPGYIGTIQIFRAAGANLIGWDAARSDLDELEDLILRYRPKFIYTNPTFQNPTGRVIPLRERLELLKLASRYRIPIIEDDPYRETYLDAPPPPPLYHLDDYNIVIYLSTFSKVLAPGLRLGWLAASEYVVDQLAAIKQRENVFTEGPGQFVLAELLESGLFEEHLKTLRVEHARRRSAMTSALVQHLPPRSLDFTAPQGGIYLWCRLNRGMESQRLLQEALVEGVVFASGEIFYPDGAGRHELRLCFSCATAARIEEGVARLAKAFRRCEANRLEHDQDILVPMV
jgi:DNA-binding transcriptional MocR family regulator